MIEDIKNALSVLRSGGIVCYPTDTIWGIGCDATNAKAIEAIYTLKQRTETMPLLILVDSEAMLERYVENPPEIAFELFELSEKPITIIFEKAINLPENLIGKDGSIGIRICREPFTQQLIQQFRKPIVSTSANIHSKPNPQYYDQIPETILTQVDYVVSHRRDDRSPQQASSIIKLTNSGICTIIRK